MSREILHPVDPAELEMGPASGLFAGDARGLWGDRSCAGNALSRCRKDAPLRLLRLRLKPH
jgi:hypothetical protein